MASGQNQIIRQKVGGAIQGFSLADKTASFPYKHRNEITN